MFRIVYFLILIASDFFVCGVKSSEILNSNVNRSNNSKFKKSSESRSKLIFILADGVRYDYVSNLDELKGFQQLASNGVKAEVRPIFPSNSYPNWYTIFTGLYAENHGMIQNFMYDPVKNETFLMASAADNEHNVHWWTNDSNTVEPIWTTAEKNGIKTAVFWLDGCTVRIANTLPTHCVPYQSFWTWPDIMQDFRNAFDTILDNFKLDKWQFALLYYEAIDSTGHVYGPNSQSRKTATKDLDDLLFYLQEEINKKNLDDQVHFILVSDHGMLNVGSLNSKKSVFIDIDDYLSADDVEMMLDRGSMAFIIPKLGKENKIIDDLRKANVKGMNFYRKSEIPDKYHYKYNRRISPIMLTANKGYFIRGFKDDDKTKPTWDLVYKGHHGYDPYTVDEMKTIMFARGKKLKKNYLNNELMMTDHYNLICGLLGIEPLKNDGNLTRIMSMFDDGTESNNFANRTIGKSSKVSKIAKSVRREIRQNSSIYESSLNNSIYLFVILALLVSQLEIYKF